ncbi:MAG: YitT family protein [Desulfovibrionaceae bacterium]
MNDFFKKLSSSKLWNLLLLTIGSFFTVTSVKALSMPNKFVPSGVFGTSVVINTVFPLIPPSIFYGIFNLLIFTLAFYLFGKHFLLYSLYGASISTLFLQTIHFQIPINDPLLVSIAAGVLSGTGAGILLHSKGSDGGLTIIGIMLYERFNISIGRFFFLYNILLFALSAFIYPLDNILYSVIMLYTLSTTMTAVQTLFNQNKFVIIISNHSGAIADALIYKLGQGVTFLNGEGAYSRESRKIIITAIPGLLVKKLEAVVLKTDPSAFIVIENTFDVVGASFRKVNKYK